MYIQVIERVDMGLIILIAGIAAWVLLYWLYDNGWLNWLIVLFSLPILIIMGIAGAVHWMLHHEN